MADIVRYNNDMNLVQFNKFKDKELDLFFSICYKMKEKNLNEITLDFSELRKLSNYTNKNLVRFVKDLDNTYKKLIELNFKYEDENVLERFVLFTQYRIEKDNRIVKIAVNKKFKYILNELGSTYTKFELEQFVSLRSIYSKNLFKILKQWESIKEKTFELEEFRRILNIPESYNFSKINVKILTIAMKELMPYFSNLKLEKIRVGRKIKKLKFSWTAKEMKQAKLIEIEIIISEKMNKAVEKTRKNKFVNPLLTKENIKKLLEIFDEKILINSFNKAYTEIKKEINFNYLKTFIENTLKQQEIKFVVEPKVQEVEDIDHTNDTDKEKKEDLKEKIKVTSEEKMLKYKEYLEKNNLKDNKFNKKSFEINFNNDFKEVENVDQLVDEGKKERKEQPNKAKQERNEERTEYLKRLKAIELDLIISNSPRLEEFKTNFMQFFRLHDFIMNDYSYLNENRVEQINIQLKELQRYFEGFKTKEEKIVELKDISTEKLLSKNGKRLFGGALLSRLEKIAKEMKVKIKYKNRIIEFKK